MVPSVRAKACAKVSSRAAARLSLVAVACACSAPQRTASPAARIDRFVSALHARGDFDGALVISDRSGVVYAGAFGFASYAPKTPHTIATPIDGASLAKPFTAAIVLGLAADQRLDLDAPIGRYLPELTYPVTVRHLLAHSSGLPSDYGWFEERMGAAEIRTTERFVALLAKEQPALAFTPGSRFEYSSPGYDLAALIAERVTGKRYAQLLATQFFTPLGMRDSFVRPAKLDAYPGVRTRGYKRTAAGVEPFDALDLEGFAGGSNIYFSARDLDRANRAWIDHPVDAGPPTIGGGTAALTLASLYRRGHWTWYVGYHQGFRSVMWRDVEHGLSIVFLTNHAIAPHIQTGLVPAVRALLSGNEPAPLVLDAPLGDDPALAGTWSIDGGEVTITREGKRWFVRSTGGVVYPMFRVDPAFFYAPGLDAWVGLSEQALVWRTSCEDARGRRVLP